MLRSKLLLILGVAMVLLGLSAGSMAYFTSEATTETNQISAGTMYIGSDNVERGVLEQPVDLADLVPGEPETVTVKVKNLGTMPTYLKGISAAIVEANEMFIANALHTRCMYEGNTLFAGSLLALDGNIVAFSQPIKLEPGETVELELEIGLDIRAGNWYKGKSLDYTITIHAFQEPDQEIGGCAIIADESNYQEIISQAQPGDVILLAKGNYDEFELKAAGLIVKAKDVVYDVAVERIMVTEETGTDEAERPTRIQGMTLNKDGTSYAVKIQTSKNLVISDDIIFAKGNAIIVSDEKAVLVTRNDLTGVHNLSNKSPEAFYNLGLDLDPAEHAL
jgi:predicted ribosomally synthesized peptide with SipW-like signal peptide